MEDPDDRDFVVGVGVCYGGSDGNVMVMKWKMVVMKARMEMEMLVVVMLMSLMLGEPMCCLSEQVGCLASFCAFGYGKLEWVYLFDNHRLGRRLLSGAVGGYDWEYLLGQ